MSIGFSAFANQTPRRACAKEEEKDSSAAGRRNPYGDHRVVKAEPRLTVSPGGLRRAGPAGQRLPYAKSSRSREVTCQRGAFVQVSQPLSRPPERSPVPRCEPVPCWLTHAHGLAGSRVWPRVFRLNKVSLCVSQLSCFVNSISDYSHLTRNLVAAGPVTQKGEHAEINAASPCGLC